jgi:hypothetical protein
MTLFVLRESAKTGELKKLEVRYGQLIAHEGTEGFGMVH